MCASCRSGHSVNSTGPSWTVYISTTTWLHACMCYIMMHGYHSVIKAIALFYISIIVAGPSLRMFTGISESKQKSQHSLAVCVLVSKWCHGQHAAAVFKRIKLILWHFLFRLWSCIVIPRCFKNWMSRGHNILLYRHVLSLCLYNCSYIANYNTIN